MTRGAARACGSRCIRSGGEPMRAAAKGPTMSHKHQQLLNTLFHDPVSNNIHWREVESLLNHLDAAIESLSGARVRVKLNRAEGILHRPHHGNALDRHAVLHLREFLGHAGVTPSLYEQRERERGQAAG
jgi:hypothetical protein